MATILIADDNKQISAILTEYAKKEGYDVINAYDGNEAVKAFEKNDLAAVLLDVMMPYKDGFEVYREIRKNSNVPVIMVTARGEDFERIMGLDIGADDYIVKPFSPGEVMARLRAVLRRVTNDKKGEDALTANVLTVGNLFVDIDSYKATIESENVSLTKKEMELLWTLAKNPGRVYTRDSLLDIIWGYDYFGDNRTVDSHIKRLRAKLDEYKKTGWDISTIWGVGYKFEVENEKK